MDDLKHLPADWDEVGKYNPVLVEIWKPWLRFVPVIDGKKTVDGSQVPFVPPNRSWLAPNQEDMKLVSPVMHYMPTKLANSVSRRVHPASAKLLNGDLQSNCWQLVGQSVGYTTHENNCIKLNYSPYAFPYNGSRSDIFSKDGAHEIMD
jgi:hypothetical protein